MQHVLFNQMRRNPKGILTYCECSGVASAQQSQSGIREELGNTSLHTYRLQLLQLFPSRSSIPLVTISLTVYFSRDFHASKPREAVTTLKCKEIQTLQEWICIPVAAPIPIAA